MKKAVLTAFGSMSALMLAYSVAQAKLSGCDSYRPDSFSELYSRALVKGVEKGEYETTGQWKARLAKMFSLDRPIIAAAKVATYDQKYDADKQVLTISSGMMKGRNAATPGGPYDYDTFKIGVRNWAEGDYVGQNAMGVTRRISVQHYDSLELYWPHDNEVALSLPSDFVDLHVAPETARDLRNHISLVLAGTPAAPYVYADWSRHDPTLEDPEDGRYFERGLVITPRCAALVDDRTWKPLIGLDPKTFVVR